jgi:heme/copper-type cytochrome/quinol oxidase subunit 2
MFPLPGTTPRNQGKPHRALWAFIPIELIFGVLLCVTFVSGVYDYFALKDILGHRATTPVAHAAQITRHVQAKLDIVINRPGMQKDWPAFSPNTLILTANSLVTLTVENYDMGDTPVPKGSPFTTVQGTVGGIAYADGHAYRVLAPDKIAHTFTVPQLGINVPVPGDTTTSKPYGVVTFTFRTGAPGIYYFNCLVPCGTGIGGWEGPMVTRGYMIGTVTVQR